MKRTTFDFLFSTEPPGITIGPPEPDSDSWIPSYFYTRSDTNTRVIRLRGAKMKTVQELMNEFAASFQLFDGFGENWLALNDCLTCLDEWMPAQGYVILFTGAESLLKNEERGQLVALLKTLDDSARWWAKSIEGNDRFNRAEVPFQTLLLLPQSGSEATIQRYEAAANEAGVRIRKCD